MPSPIPPSDSSPAPGSLPLPLPPPEAPAGFHAGVIAIVGRANAGKSSLLNALLEENVSVVSPVAQTTRRPVRGIWNEPGLQLVFLDTPGIRQATHSLGSLLNRTARGLVTGANLILLVVDASRPPREEDIGWMKKLSREDSPVAIALNKTDLGLHRRDYENAWTQTQNDCASRDPGFSPSSPQWFELSALTGNGLPELRQALRNAAPLAPPLFPLDMLTDDPGPFFIADVIRAQINARLKAELPHAIAVAVDSVKDTGTRVDVAATIYVEKPSQRPIVIGNHAKMIRDIRHAAEKDLREIYDVPHKLELWVKVEPDWSRNYWMLKKFGYV